MKRKTGSKPNVGTPVRDDVEVLKEANEPEEEPMAQPVKAKTEYRVKCIWSSKVNVSGDKTPSGTAYSFQPGQEQPVTSEADMWYLISLERGQSGCCGSTGEKRHYFERA